LYTTATNDTGATHLLVQKDHDVVIYDDNQKAQWKSGTEGQGEGKVRLVLQDDGNLVLLDASDTNLWATNTSQSS